jgi:hypothetical protein
MTGLGPTQELASTCAQIIAWNTHISFSLPQDDAPQIFQKIQMGV